MRVLVHEDDFDLGAEVARFGQGRRDTGAVVTFTGRVRDTEDTLAAMEIEHYPGMTQSALEEIAQTAQMRWSLADVLVIHRYGTLTPGAQIMMVGTAAAHRRDAFEAADFLMDYLKSRAPFWKREIGKDGTATWVDAKADDEDALGRW